MLCHVGGERKSIIKILLCHVGGEKSVIKMMLGKDL